LVLARVDDRLIHGQVVVGWARHTQADCIIVANDAVAADPMQRTLLPMAVPQGIEVAIYRVREAAERLSSGAHAARRAILLFSSPADALAFSKAGGSLSELNVGGIRFAPGKEQLRKSVSMGTEDKDALTELYHTGVSVYLQMVPADPKEGIFAVLNGPPQK
jgi:mannose/fructose/N-acetylgalactosamine-specific phosphotransferase system component IIB